MKAAAVLLVVLVLVVLPPVAGASSASSQKDAAAQACSASARINAEVMGFGNVVISPGTPDYVRLSLRTMGADLLTMRAALPSASPAVRLQATPAAAGFGVLLRRLTPGLLAAPAGAAPLPLYRHFMSTVALLPAAYARTLGRVTTCG